MTDWNDREQIEGKNLTTVLPVVASPFDLRNIVVSIDQQKASGLQDFRTRVHTLRRELYIDDSISESPDEGFYARYYITTGLVLGLFGATISLLINVMGAPLAGKNPLELIRVYLTFPLGEKALQLAEGSQSLYAIGDGVILAIGCLLYLVTGMLLGVPFFIALVGLTEGRSTLYRMVIATVLSTLIWAINFWGILSWLQPLLFGGNWITNPELLPTSVALATHLIFGWTMALLYPWSEFQAYEQDELQV